MWEYKLELVYPGKILPRFAQIYNGTEEGKKQAMNFKKQHCDSPTGAYYNNPKLFKENVDRGGEGKADRLYWIITYQEFFENDFGLEIP